MNNKANQSNPYSILGIQRDATTAEIEKAHRQKLIEAQYSVSLSVDHIEAAYLVLIDPDERHRLDNRLIAASLKKGVSTEEAVAKVKIAPSEKERTRQRRKALLASVLLAVFAFSLYFFVLRQAGEICPRCHRNSLVETRRTESLVTVSCTRTSCGFSFEFDEVADLAHDPDED